MLRQIASRVCMIASIMLLGGLLGATLVRFSPGFGVDEAEANYLLSEESKAARRAQRDADRNVLAFYARYLGGLLRGDLGESRAFHRPVAGLLKERLPVTLWTTGYALLLAWVVGIALAVGATTSRMRWLDGWFSGATSLFLCVPAAVLGLLFLFWGAPPAYAIALLVVPKIYRYTFNLLESSYELPHILTARAKGLSEAQVLWWHVAPAAAPQLLALAGVSATVALSAALPIEVICDVAGIGQLAWSAAQARDLTLLVNLTLLIAFFTATATAFSELVSERLRRTT